MDTAAIESLVARLDTKDARAGEDAWGQLRHLGEAVVPSLLGLYPRARTWQGRTSLVFHSIRYARTSEAAFQLGVMALADRSYMVRYRACGLLAYSLRMDALAPLRPVVVHADPRTAEDAAAAIDAIEHRNHNYFVDRDHSGRSFWTVNDTDRQAP
ncbi:MAG: hypothetical protein ABL997_07525 [Planctomycetota bacterium]